jgi:hypothetical protein
MKISREEIFGPWPADSDRAFEPSSFTRSGSASEQREDGDKFADLRFPDSSGEQDQSRKVSLNTPVAISARDRIEDRKTITPSVMKEPEAMAASDILNVVGDVGQVRRSAARETAE